MQKTTIIFFAIFITLLGSVSLKTWGATVTNTGSLNIARDGHTATPLPNGKVLVAGGYGTNGVLSSSEIFDPTLGTWTNAGNFNGSRWEHTATLLPNGKVLIAGGISANPIQSLQLFDPLTTNWTSAGSMVVPRFSHTSTLLLNGKVLFVGGTNGPAYAEIYDPASGLSSITGLPESARFNHTATLLPNGKVLITGGVASGIYFNTTRLFDPATGTWSASGNMTSARSSHTATLLPNGKVFVAGGYTSGGGYLSSAELYDPATGTWTPANNLLSARGFHTASLLPNGKLLLAGGYNNSGVIASLDTYDFTSGSWVSSNSLITARVNQTASVLFNGKVLFVGGDGVSGTLSSSEFYDIASGLCSLTSSMNKDRFRPTSTMLPNGNALILGGELTYNVGQVYNSISGSWSDTAFAVIGYDHAATLMSDGKVLITGGRGYNTDLISFNSRLYNPNTDTWSNTGFLNTSRFNHSATLLRDGKVLVVGGFDFTNALASAELFDPTIGTWTNITPMNFARRNHTATLLPNGKVLIAGGFDNLASITNAEVFDPSSKTWSLVASLNVARASHKATLLADGKVLVTGGNSFGNITATAEMFNPVTGLWSATTSMNDARANHTLTLLPNGAVLATGGQNQPFGGFLYSTEVFNPEKQTWSASSALIDPRASHTAILLPTGKVLITGGTGFSTIISSVLFDSGLGFSSAWQPQIAVNSSTNSIGGAFSFSGSKLRGISEACGGNSQSSPSDCPIVQLRNLENNQISFLNATNWTTNSCTSFLNTNLTGGWTMATIFVNGISSTSVVTYLQPFVSINTNFPPQILLQPVSSVVQLSGSASFGVTATGSSPLAYRWQLNGTNLPNSNIPTLVLNNVQATNEGVYQVIITNLYGSVTSSPVTLVVNLCSPPPSSLANWWKCEGDAIDSVGLNSGLLQNVTATTGFVGSALNFNGSNSAVVINNPPSPQTFSIEAWVKFNNLDSVASTPGLQIFIFRQNTRMFNFEGFAFSKQRDNGGAGDRLAFEMTSENPVNDKLVTTTFVTTNVFYHIVGTFDGAAMKLYLNGALQSTATHPYPVNYGATPMYFGTSGTNVWDGKFAGVLDEVSLYTTALSAAQVSTLYGAGVNGKCAVPSSIIRLPNYQQMNGQNLGGGKMRLTFTGSPAQNYAVDRTFKLAPANWIPLATNTADSWGTLIFTNTAVITTNNFWRIRSVP
jgi:N-acetylneuraminic acid mutarotase